LRWWLVVVYVVVGFGLRGGGAVGLAYRCQLAGGFSCGVAERLPSLMSTGLQVLEAADGWRVRAQPHAAGQFEVIIVGVQVG